MEFCCWWQPHATEYIRQDPFYSNWVNRYHKAQTQSYLQTDWDVCRPFKDLVHKRDSHLPSFIIKWCPPFCKISGFSLPFIYILLCWLVAAERFWGLILQVFQRMNALLNAPFTSVNDLYREMLCVQISSTISPSDLCWRPDAREIPRSADTRGSHKVNYPAPPGWQQNQKKSSMALRKSLTLWQLELVVFYGLLVYK